MNLREPFPLRTYLGLSLLGAACGLAGALAGATLASNAHRVATTLPVVEPAVEPPDDLVPIASTTTARDERQAAPSAGIGFVIEVDGASWMILDVDPTTIPHHRARLATGDGSDAIAALRGDELTSELRAWRGQEVIVDGTCTDTLLEFALISQVTGDPVYADDGTQHWTTATIEANGSHLVAAKLAHCTGSYARAASAPHAVPFTEIADGEKLANDATTQLLHSATGREAHAHLAAQYTGEGNAPLDFDSVVEITTKVAIDPRTGRTWVAVHAHADFSCGGPEVNIFGLYRADDAGLVTIREQPSPDLAGLEALVDLDGDGVPEILGNGWLSPNRAFYDQDLRTLVTYDVPFFGCPC